MLCRESPFGLSVVLDGKTIRLTCGSCCTRLTFVSSAATFFACCRAFNLRLLTSWLYVMGFYSYEQCERGLDIV
jgi:hypothetical protein